MLTNFNNCPNFKQQFRNAIIEAGITAPAEVIDDRKIHRFSTNDRIDNKDGWYVLYGDSNPAGSFGCWRSGVQFKWKADLGRPYRSEELQALKERIELIDAQQKKESEGARNRAISIWSKASPVLEHPYLKIKGIKPYVAREYNGTLTIPMYISDELVSLQFIDKNAAKRFLTGGSVNGSYCMLGEVTEDTCIYICEGYATGASIHEATGYPVLVSFTSANLLKVAEDFRLSHPNIKIILCADDDWKTSVNNGIIKANQAALAVGGLVAIPEFGPDRKEKETDFNDMHQASGVVAIERVLNTATAPEATASNTEWNDPIPLPLKSPVKQFSPDLLPESLREWVMDIAHRMQCPPDFAAVGAVVGLSSLIGAKAVIRPKAKDDWEVTANIWGGAVGRSGVMKSPPINETLKPLNLLAKKESERIQTEYEAWLLDNQISELDMKDREQKAKVEIKKGNHAGAREIIEGAETLTMPIGRRFITNDATVEKLGEIMAANPWGLLAYQDELYGLLTRMDKQGQEGARAFYLQSYDGNQGYTFDRISRGTIHIPRVCLSLLGGIQPGRLSEYIRDAMTGGCGDDGLLQRFGLLVYPDVEPIFNHVDRYPDTTAKAAATEVFNRLSEIEPTDNKPIVWSFTPEAQALFLEWWIPFNQELRSGELHPAIESHLRKYRKLIPALALIFAYIDTPNNNNCVGEVELARALDWGDYLRTHAERIYQSATMPETSGAKSLLQKIQSGKLKDCFTPREIAQRQWSGLNDVDAVRKALKLLLDHDYLKQEIFPAGGKGGRPSEKYLINPKALGDVKND